MKVMNEIGYTDNGAKEPVVLPPEAVPASWEEQMEVVRKCLDIEEGCPETAFFIGTLGAVNLTEFPAKLTGSLRAWLLNRLGNPKLSVIDKRRYVTMESSSATKRVVRKVKDEWDSEGERRVSVEYRPAPLVLLGHGYWLDKDGKKRPYREHPLNWATVDEGVGEVVRDEEALLALLAHHINRERHNLQLRREFAKMQNACLATKNEPQGKATDENGRWFYEMPPIVELSRFGDMEHEEFHATLLTPSGKVFMFNNIDGRNRPGTQEDFERETKLYEEKLKEHKQGKNVPLPIKPKKHTKPFQRLQNAIRTLSRVKRGSPSEIMSKLWKGDYVASTACVRAGTEWRVIVFPMKDPKKAVSTFKDDNEQEISVFDYEQSILKDEDGVDELVTEDPFSDEPMDAEGSDAWSCLPDMNMTYSPYTDNYYNSRPLLTLLAYEAGVDTEFANSGLTRNVRDELGALYVDYCRKIGEKDVECKDGTIRTFPVYAFNELGFLTKEEFATAISNEVNSQNKFHPVKKTSTRSWMPGTTYKTPEEMPTPAPRKVNAENMWQARIRISKQQTREAWKLKQLRRFEGKSIPHRNDLVNPKNKTEWTSK